MWILFIRGKINREKRLGCVADFCPVCRKIQAFEVAEVRRASHIYFIPIERGEFLGNRKTCLACRVVSDCHLVRYVRFARSSRIPLPALIEETYPTLRETYAERLALEKKIAGGGEGVDPATRQKMLMEVFSLAKPHFDIGYGHEGRRILALALRPLWPTVDEIRACLDRYRGHRIAAKVQTEELMTAIYPETEVKDPNRFSY